ncbi:hypothetical protein HCN44_003626 [Aphidius gifuensis]|uniref:RING-type domain-containing protein n=1 Tax=Aphidius gifuensis TaxID=684658 RepID=A0A834XIK3_APHGI|nr:uncharacterized protein LOC122858843 [Aphidius gifuensis]KAF7987763.1 hypothetical protein HCN44_003626 [Aphidius gifuensis]
MGFLDDELEEVSKLCQNVIPGSCLVTCFPTMVRVEITKTVFKKIIACIQFSKIYPADILLLELKSKTLSQKLLSGLTEICEKNCKNLIGKAQILPTLKFLNNFIDENPLICCYDEINSSKKLLQDCDIFRLKQKISTINLEVHCEAYFFKTKIFIPDDYPTTSAKLTEVVTNFPPLFERFLLGQAKELGRRCVEPPLRKLPNKIFKPSPSLDKIASFIIRSVKQIPEENCQLCKIKCLPKNPENIIRDENADLHIERLYCSHLFHLQCLVTYMKTPPFHGGKKCPGCSERVYHEKWGLSEKLAEDRWAHEQARARELAEVTDFFV